MQDTRKEVLNRDSHNQDRLPLKNIGVCLNPLLKEISSTSLSEEKILRLKDRFGEAQIIRILAAGTQKTDTDNEISWQSRSDTGADIRVAAGFLLSKTLDLPVLVGSKYPDEKQPAPSDVMTEELKQMNLAPENILSDRDSYDTISEIVNLIKLAEVNEWKSVAFVTNEYHIKRVGEIIKNLNWLSSKTEQDDIFRKTMAKLESGQLSTSTISAEEVVKVCSPEIYSKYNTLKPDTKLINKRTENENRGVEAICNGVYKRFDPFINEYVELKRK